MDISTVLAPDQLARLQQNVDLFNKGVSGVREVKNTLNKDDFLKILITQLTHQDPTQPLKDREFIAQMAQFSSLEQMMNVSGELAKVTELIGRSQAFSLLGKTVSISTSGKRITGTVDEVTGGEFPQVLVDGTYYDYGSVESVRAEQGASR